MLTSHFMKHYMCTLDNLMDYHDTCIYIFLVLIAVLSCLLYNLLDNILTKKNSKIVISLQK